MLTSAFANFYFWKLKIVLRTKMFLWFILRTLPPPFFSLQVFFCLFLLLFLLPPERPIVSITTSFFTRFFQLKKEGKKWETPVGRRGKTLRCGPTTRTTTTKIILSPPSPPPPRGLETFSGDSPSVSRTQKGENSLWKKNRKKGRKRREGRIGSFEPLILTSAFRTKKTREDLSISVRNCTIAKPWIIGPAKKHYFRRRLYVSFICFDKH